MVGNPIKLGDGSIDNSRGIAYDPVNKRMYVTTFIFNTSVLILSL